MTLDQPRFLDSLNSPGDIRSSDHSPGEFIEEAVRFFLEDRERAQQRNDAWRRIGTAVDEAGLYERILIPDEE